MSETKARYSLKFEIDVVITGNDLKEFSQEQIAFIEFFQKISKGEITHENATIECTSNLGGVSDDENEMDEIDAEILSDEIREELSAQEIASMEAQEKVNEHNEMIRKEGVCAQIEKESKKSTKRASCLKVPAIINPDCEDCSWKYDCSTKDGIYVK